MIQAELAAVAENPFTSRPPSSASEIEFDLPGAGREGTSTVSSPVHRPLTARGRYSVDIQGDELTGRNSVGSEIGRSSVDSALRRSFSSDHHPELNVGQAGETGEEDFNSDSSNSRPSSRVDGAGERSLSRLYDRSHSRNRRSGIGRRSSLLRLTEEVDMPVIPLERATSASSAVAPAALMAGRSPRGGDTDREGEDSGEVTDVPLDSFETELGPVRNYELAPDSVPTNPGIELFMHPLILLLFLVLFLILLLLLKTIRPTRLCLQPQQPQRLTLRRSCPLRAVCWTSTRTGGRTGSSPGSGVTRGSSRRRRLWPG